MADDEKVANKADTKALVRQMRQGRIRSYRPRRRSGWAMFPTTLFLIYLSIHDLWARYESSRVIGTVTLAILLVGTWYWADSIGWLRGYSVGHREGLREAPEIAAEAVVDVLQAQMFTRYLFERMGTLCEVCGVREDEMEFGMEQGPGDPPLYLQPYLRCKAHTDLQKWPPTEVLTSEQIADAIRRPGAGE